MSSGSATEQQLACVTNRLHGCESDGSPREVCFRPKIHSPICLSTLHTHRLKLENSQANYEGQIIDSPKPPVAHHTSKVVRAVPDSKIVTNANSSYSNMKAGPMIMPFAIGELIDNSVSALWDAKNSVAPVWEVRHPHNPAPEDQIEDLNALLHRKFSLQRDLEQLPDVLGQMDAQYMAKGTKEYSSSALSLKLICDFGAKQGAEGIEAGGWTCQLSIGDELYRLRRNQNRTVKITFCQQEDERLGLIVWDNGNGMTEKVMQDW